MPGPIPPDYDEIKVPFYQLKEGDFLEAEPGNLERIIQKGGMRSSESFAITETGKIRIKGYGVKSPKQQSTSN